MQEKTERRRKEGGSWFSSGTKHNLHHVHIHFKSPFLLLFLLLQVITAEGAASPLQVFGYDKYNCDMRVLPFIGVKQTSCDPCRISCRRM